jgi:hypothetical protein
MRHVLAELMYKFDKKYNNNMNKENTIITVKNYFSKGTFIIPNFQRGFKWGVPDEKSNKDAVEILMTDLLEAYNNKQNEYFLQGVTVVENDDKTEITLVDGQQRTTTLFLFLCYINKKINDITNESELNKIDDLKIVINYKVRRTPDEYLKKIAKNKINLDKIQENKDDDFQDIYYFKKAIRTIREKINKKINNGELESFKTFILENVKLIYIPIPESKAATTFKMMNGNKAQMKVEELIKSAFLSKASREGIKEKSITNNLEMNEIFHLFKEKVGVEWEINSLRSKYAREWDKWLYWWNRKDVADFYGTNRPMGLLIEYFYYLNEDDDKYSTNDKNVASSYDAFKNKFITPPKENINERKSIAKQNFLKLRKIQKVFEDWFNNPKIYNYLGLIFKTGKAKKKVILYFLKKHEGLEDKLKKYVKWALVNCSHNQIIKYIEGNENSDEDCNQKLNTLISILNEDDVYNDNEKYKMASLQLLRLNIEEDNKLKRKFDFSICNNRSLEHIHPKSKIYKVVDGKNIRNDGDSECSPDNTYINSTDFPEGISEHCIGNLVLLDKDDNSSFKDKTFEEKKQNYFDIEKMKKSRLLLHTISVFSKSKWEIDEIKENKEGFINNLKNIYKHNN